MTSKSSSDSSASVEAKLVWNSPLDAEESFEAKMAELKATLIKESVYHCVSEKESMSVLPFARRARRKDSLLMPLVIRHGRKVSRT